MTSQTPKVSDVAMVCYLDLCKAAIYVPPTITDSSLRTLAPEMADELKVHRPADAPLGCLLTHLPCSIALWTRLTNSGHHPTRLM